MLRLVVTTLALGTMLNAIAITQAAAKQKTLDANGNVAGVIVSHKTGASARVGVAHAAKFQAYIDDLENNHGATIKFMGGIRRGRCSDAHLHPCGRAIDVCQLSRGRVDHRCHLPDRSSLAIIAKQHGLFEGGQWCHHDYGHAQVGVTAGACGSTYAARKKRVRYAKN